MDKSQVDYSSPQRGFMADPQSGGSQMATAPPVSQGQAAMAMPPQSYGAVNEPAVIHPWQPNPSSDGGPSYQGDDVSDTDPEDNDDESPLATLPPPDVSKFSAPPGYEQAIIGGGIPLPPPPYEPPDEASRPLQTFSGIGTLNEQQVRDAICAFADQQCCYGTGAAESMNFEKMDASGGLHVYHIKQKNPVIFGGGQRSFGVNRGHIVNIVNTVSQEGKHGQICYGYQLESFTETRSTSFQHLPYKGGPVDGPHCGPAPAVWDIFCEPLNLFETHDKFLEVPHTSDVKVCHNCTGSGLVGCPRCHGGGEVTCSSCSGSGSDTFYRDGKRETRSCSSCHGSGRERCLRCGGDGRITCPVCQGYCKLRWFIQLKVQYINNLEDFIHETTDLPDELIREVSGKTVFEQTLPFVWPISQYHVSEINENSIRIVERHRTAWPQSKMLQQRQTLRSVPVTEVKFKYKDKEGRFWVYGNEHEVHCPDYPQRCCWGCTIL